MFDIYTRKKKNEGDEKKKGHLRLNCLDFILKHLYTIYIYILLLYIVLRLCAYNNNNNSNNGGDDYDDDYDGFPRVGRTTNIISYNIYNIIVLECVCVCKRNTFLLGARMGSFLSAPPQPPPPKDRLHGLTPMSFSPFLHVHIPIYIYMINNIYNKYIYIYVIRDHSTTHSIL